MNSQHDAAYHAGFIAGYVFFYGVIALGLWLLVRWIARMVHR